MEEYGDYALSTLFGLMSGYIILWVRKRLMIDETVSRNESWKWRSLLKLLSEGVIVCTASEVLFSNDSLRAILETEEPSGEAERVEIRESEEDKERDRDEIEENRQVFAKVSWLIDGA